jgi:hypothetical protein
VQSSAPKDQKPVPLRKVAIAEDEADLIVALRRKDEPGIPLEQVLAEHGLHKRKSG